MSEIKMPFREDMQKAILEGRKTMTCRTKRYGSPGDFFMVGDARFMLTSVTKMNLGIVATQFYKDEGTSSPGEFINLWDEIHPRRNFTSLQTVWAHRFRHDYGYPCMDCKFETYDEKEWDEHEKQNPGHDFYA